MRKRPVQNVSASVRARLLSLSRKNREDFQLVLTRYALERLLYRLAASRHRDAFVLKGAMLFSLWTGQPHRATRDLDLLGFGDDDASRLEGIFREICALDVPDDGLDFEAASVRASLIREDQVYGGIRVQMLARLGVARVSLQVDVGFGDAVKAVVVTVPTLLDFPAPRLRAYPRESVIAEKVQAMVALGMGNSRMKDFFDVWVLARSFEFDGATLANAIEATFKRRRTELPSEAPTALTSAFANDPSKQTQWRAFLKRSKVADENTSLDQVVADLRRFLLPVLIEAENARESTGRWPAGGSWG